MKKITRRLKIALRKPKKGCMAYRARKYREMMNDTINRCGYFIQGVSNFDNSFAYTIGRQDKKKPEFYMSSLTGASGRLFNEIVDRFDKGEIKPKEVFECNLLLSRKTGEPSKAIIMPVKFKDIEELMLGAIRRQGVEKFKSIPTYEIILADENNEIHLV